jgi:hypothetical protein
LAPTEMEPTFLGVDCNLEAGRMYADEEGTAVARDSDFCF